MIITQCRRYLRPKAHAGFTLVEMLVAVTLVLLMMTMFAEIFSVATSSLSKQKSLAELDQRQRLTSTLIRADIQERTFKRLVAIHPAEVLSLVQNSRNQGTETNQGYFYISENEPYDDTDDVLQLTVQRPDASGEMFYGRARELVDISCVGIITSPPNTPNPNQPENDDGDPTNKIGSSTHAEIAYFLRGSNLCRRVLLVRDTPFNAASDSPTTFDNISLVQTGIYPQGTSFYLKPDNPADRFPNDFDYAATYDYGAGRLEFLGGHSLENDNRSASTLVLALPNRRFGFQPTLNPKDSRPMEYVGTTFIGRFTHQETSDPDFAYPGDPGLGPDGNLATTDDTNPYFRQGLTVAPNQVVIPFQDGPRQGEDILMSNVLSFDIKVWDNVLQPPCFVDIGHSGKVGEYAQNPTLSTNKSHGNHNTAYGPRSSNNRCFDTWHTGLNVIDPTTPPYSVTNPPPFRPVLDYGVDGVPGSLGDDDKDGVPENDAEAGWPGTDDLLSPLKAIQIQIRFRDISSGAARDFTLIESLQ